MIKVLTHSKMPPKPIPDLTKQQCKDLETTRINPLTKRKLKSDNGVYKKLIKQCEKHKVPTDAPITRTECLQFIANKRVNPRTGRRIKKNRDVYNKYMEACKRFNIQEKSERDQILEKLAAQCYNEADPILLEEFKDMSINELKSIIKIGPGDKKNCYLVDSIIPHYTEHVQKGKSTRDPMNPSHVITQQEIADMKKAKRKLEPQWQSPRRRIIPQYHGLVIDFTPTMSRTPSGAIVPLLHIWVVRDATNETIFDLGYIPNDIESVHTGSVDYTTSVAVYLLRRLWDERKLLIGDNEPYRCCTVHLRKSKHYWSQVPQSEMIRKFKNMIDEFNSTL